MATIEHSRSSRSTYPLQTPLGHSRRSSVATNDSGETRSRRRYSIVSQQGNTDAACPFQHATGVSRSGETSFPAPTPQQLPSPLLSGHDRQSWSSGINGISVSSHTEPSSWSRGSYPITVTKHRSDGHSLTHPISNPEQPHERPSSQLSNASSKGTNGKTLRRTPRSRRIESPIQSREDNKSTSTAHDISTNEFDATEMGGWERQRYPLQSASAAVPGTFPESPVLHTSLETCGQPEPLSLFGVAGSSEETVAEVYPPTPSYSSTRTATDIIKKTSLVRDGFVNGMAESSRDDQKSGQSIQTSKGSKRRAYPLQTPASNTTLRDLPTPPPSPPTEDVAQLPNGTSVTNSESNDENDRSVNHLQQQTFSSRSAAKLGHIHTPPESAKGNDSEADENTMMYPSTKGDGKLDRLKSLHRQAYPLQSPASTMDLQAPKKLSSPVDETHDVEEPTSDAHLKAGQQKVDRTPSRRQAYPLQSPASVMDLQKQQTSTITRDAATSEQNVLMSQAQKPHLSKKDTPLRRRMYPLQAPASVTDLQSPQMPHPAERQDQEINQAPQAPSKGRAEELQKHKSLRRQAYPLQAPASVANLRDVDVPYSKGLDHEAEDMPNVTPEKQNKNLQYRKSSRRQAYPLQTPASVLDLKQVQQSISSEEAGHFMRDQTSVKMEDQKFESEVLPRQEYPLQSPTAVMKPNALSDLDPLQVGEAHVAQHIPQIRTEAPQSPDPSTPLWRRNTYPLQTSENVLPSRSGTPLPAADQSGDHDSILLPKHIPAVKDTAQHNYQGRTIVVCLDGTGDKFDADNSNIVHLVSALKKDDARQVTYYQAGIGTYSAGGLSSGFAAAMDMAVGSGLGLHVRDAYQFLMHSYKEGDKICIFGFSRGAYTARCLAGMVHKVGLLPPRNIEQIPFAYEFYSNDTPEGWRQSEDFKKTFSIDVNVYFIGCFDSVASVGFIPRQLPLSSTPKSKPIYFRHAMALDERRAKFKVCRHQAKTWEEIVEGATPTSALLEAAQSKLPNYKEQNDTPKLYSPSSYGAKNHPNLTDEEYNRLMAPDDEFETDVLEVWFAGAHADVGGGAVANVERHKLAQIPLRWMIRQAFECNTGIIFKTKVLAEHGIDVHTLWPKYECLQAPNHGPPPSFLEKFENGLPPRSIRQSKLIPTDESDNGEQLFHLKSPKDEDWTPEQLEDFYDAISPLNDQLLQAPSWWILELWPVQLKMPVTPGKYYVRTGLNLGRYRAVEDFEPNLHWTVLHRMQHMGYKLEVRATKQTKWKTVV